MRKQNDTCLGSAITAASRNRPSGKINPRNDLVFVRHGQITPVHQDGFYKEEIGFHTPPAKWGFYAFVYPHIEKFLLGTHAFAPHRMEWIRDGDGNKIRCSIEVDGKWETNPIAKPFLGKYDDFSGDYIGGAKGLTYVIEDGIDYLARHVEPKYIKHRGELWHHLQVRRNEIIDERGAWVKTDYETYKSALNKEIGRMKDFIRRTGIGYSKDHMEVFIEG